MPSGGGGSSGGGGTSTTVQQADPWAGQQPSLSNLFGMASYLAGMPSTGLTADQQAAYGAGSDFANSDMMLSFFPGQTYAGFSPETEAALAAQTQRALYGSPLTSAGQQQLYDTMSGKYLEAGNPYMKELTASIYDSIRPTLDSQFVGAGRYGSPGHQEMMTRSVANAVAPLAFDTYNQERQKQLQAGMLAPQYAQQDYFDIAKLGEVGSAWESLEQQGINEAMQRYQFEQMEPWSRLGLFNDFIQGNYGGTMSGTQTYSPWGGGRTPLGAGLLGGAMGGAGLGSMFGPWGMGLGGMLGGLLGGLFR